MTGLSVMQLHLAYVLFLAAISTGPTTSASSAAVLRADLTHVDSGRGFTKRELLRQMAARTTARAAILSCPSGRSPAVTVPVGRDSTGKAEYNSEYNIHFRIGTPRPQPVVAMLDTGSDLIWTQCACGACFEQPFPVLDPAASATYRAVPCSDPLCERGGLEISGCTIKEKLCFYAYLYGDKSSTFGFISQDTFTFQAPNGADVGVPNLRFGCGRVNHITIRSNESGVAGFGRGPLSLPSQLKVPRFSHCFTTIVEGKTSPVFLGAPDNLEAQATGPIQSTPFVRNPASPALATFYYLSLKGVTVGTTRLPFGASTFALKGDGSGGTIIDSGTSLTTFPDAVFQSIRKAFVSQFPLPTEEFNGMLCFGTPPKKAAPAVPKLILHLEGMDWDLPRENYVLEGDDEDGTGGGLCLVIRSSGENNPMTTIGNFQQQNMHIVYDLQANKLDVVPARCDKL